MQDVLAYAFVQCSKRLRNLSTRNPRNISHLCSCRTLQILGLSCHHFWMAMRISWNFRFHVGILYQHCLVEQGWRPITDWPTTVAPKWAIASNHAATMEENAIREAPVAPTEGQAGRWQAITDTTTVESSLVDLKVKGLHHRTDVERTRTVCPMA